MATTNFIDDSTVIVASWLNDVDSVVYQGIGAGIETPQQYGAVGDGVTDDDAAFVLAEATAKLIFIPKTAAGYEMTSAVSTTDGAWLPDPTLSWSQWSDDGQLDLERGYFTDKNNGANIWRLADRVFVGPPSTHTAGINAGAGGGNHWADNQELQFTSGGTYTTVAGDVITGATSGATATIQSVALESGTFAGGDAAGRMVFARLDETGDFQSETLNVGANTNVATISRASVAASPNYLPRAATLLVEMGTPGTGLGGGNAITALARSSTVTSGATIGFGSAIVNDRATASTWAFIGEMQREAGAAACNGLELSIKNKGDDLTSTPYTTVHGARGIRIASGGDPAFGGVSTNNNDNAIGILKHGNSTHTWNKGIIFHDDGINGTDGVTGVGTVIEMARGHQLVWRYAGDGDGVKIDSLVDAALSGHLLRFQDRTIQFYDNQSTPKLYFNIIYPATGVNYFNITSSATGDPIILAALGDDTNIDLRLNAKGSGNIRFGTFSSTGDTATNGYITIKDAGGTTRKLATVA